MMNMRKKNIQYHESDRAQVAMLPYANSSLRAVIILPKDRSVDAFQNAFDYTQLERSAPTEVILSLPKFKIESTLSLAESLKSLGVRKIF